MTECIKSAVLNYLSLPDSSEERQEEDGDGDDEGDEHDLQGRSPAVPRHEGLVRSLVVILHHGGRS